MKFCQSCWLRIPASHGLSLLHPLLIGIKDSYLRSDLGFQASLRPEHLCRCWGEASPVVPTTRWDKMIVPRKNCGPPAVLFLSTCLYTSYRQLEAAGALGHSHSASTAGPWPRFSIPKSSQPLGNSINKY